MYTYLFVILFDTVNIAKKGPKGKGCPKIKCEDTRYGCCPGEDKEIATGPNYAGCKEINKKNCTANFFGCCLDGKTAGE